MVGGMAKLMLGPKLMPQLCISALFEKTFLTILSASFPDSALKKRMPPMTCAVSGNAFWAVPPEIDVIPSVTGSLGSI